MIETIIEEIEKYGFPIIAESSEGTVIRNGSARGIRSLAHAMPSKRLPKSEKRRISELTEGEASVVCFSKAVNNGRALAVRLDEYTFFAYLPMLSHIGKTEKLTVKNIPVYALKNSSLPEAVKYLAMKNLPKKEIEVDSFARICSMTARFVYSEDMVNAKCENGGTVDAETAFYAFGKALEAVDLTSASELSEPRIEIEMTDGVFSVSAYGEELCSLKAQAVSAVEPYSFTEAEYGLALQIALAASIIKSRR